MTSDGAPLPKSLGWAARRANAPPPRPHPPGAAAEDALAGQDPGTSYSEPLVADAPAKPAKPRKTKAKAD